MVIAEKQYVDDPTPDRLRDWLEEQQNYRALLIRKAENKQLFQKPSTFGEGESVRQIFALLVRTNSSPSVVPMIIIREGRISSYTSEIVDKFKEF